VDRCSADQITDAWYAASNVLFFETDVTSSSKIKAVAEEIRKVHGDPTILINNAGIGAGATILDEAEEKIRRTFDVNTISHFILVKEFVPSMVRQNHGHIVTIASMASFISLGSMVDYACSKASALAFHEGIRQELRYWYKAGKVRTRYVTVFPRVDRQKYSVYFSWSGSTSCDL
jgi:short-subunit dehydrogenase